MPRSSARRLPDGWFERFFDIPGMDDLKSNPLRLPDKLLDQCERAVGLDHPNPEFRRRIADTVLLSSLFHQNPPVRRPSELREQLSKAEKHRTTALAELEQLMNAIAALGWEEDKFVRLNKTVLIPYLAEMAKFTH